METPDGPELPGVRVYVHRRQPRWLLVLALSGSFLLAASPCAELSRGGQREEFEECGAAGCVPSCILPVPGCMQPRKTNYNPAANIDDGSCDDNPCDTAANDCDANAHCGHIGPGAFVCVCKSELGYVGDGRSCIQPVYACTYEQATNYDARCALAVGACIEDGSCEFLAAGCMDPNADNYVPEAGVNDGSCYVYGCTHPLAENFNPDATTNCVAWDGAGSCVSRNDSCVLTGCQDPRADNYDPDATVDTDGQGSCVYSWPGCTYNDSLNFNATANTDDGSCIPIVKGCTHPDATNFEPRANLDDESCQWIPCDPAEDDCHQNATCTHMGPQMHDCRCQGGFVGDGWYCTTIVQGCTDAAAFNYNSSANVDDGGCVAIMHGCMDEDAYNFDPSANVDDGSCIARVCGCIDTRAVNFEATANTDDGSCDIDPCSSGFDGCAEEAICSYVPRGTGWPSFRSEWNGVHSACERIPVAQDADVCSRIAAGMRLCPSLGNSSTVTSVSCVATGFCPEEPGDPLSISACDYLSSTSQFVSCGYRQCVPREWDVQCVPGTYSCRCRDQDIGNGYHCELRHSGCTDSLAFNYDPYANVDDGTCVSVVPGCSDSMARNYNRLANTDDGSCVVHPCNSTAHGCSEHAICAVVGPSKHACECFEGYGGNGTTCIMVRGCTYPRADNYNRNATQDDGSCRFTIDGCTDPNATNFVAAVGANQDDGSCVYVRRGCTYSVAWNYDPTATVDDSSCIAVPIFGCRDPAAVNFNPEANVNSTCIPRVFGCIDTAAYNTNPVANTDDGSCNYNACVTRAHNCHSLAVCNFTAPLEFNCTCVPGNIGNGTWCEKILTGCTARDAWNFDALANVDDGSCISRVFGCTDPSMFNYDSHANTDDGGCVPVVLGCTMETALNFAPEANTNSSDCIHPARAAVKVYVGSHGHQMGWTFRSITHDVNLSLPDGVLAGKEYQTSLNGYGYVQLLELPAGEWVLYATDRGGNGWPGSQLRIDHPAEVCTAIDPGDESHAQLCNEWQVGWDAERCISIADDATNAPVCTYSPGSVLVDKRFGTRSGKIDFDYAVSIGFDVPCSHHAHCARFEYCDVGRRCKSCGQIGNSTGCTPRNDSLAIPVVDSLLERSRRAQPPPVGIGEVWMSTECPWKCLPILGCTNSRAMNYNHSANTEDGSCMIMGCQNTLARNYDPQATVDNSTSCEIVGCTDSTAVNYDPLATEEDASSCIAAVIGCTNHAAVNFDPIANTDDGSCNINPCTAPGYSTGCHSNATCEHLGPELHTCSCAHGFVGNGLDCQSVDESLLQDSHDALPPLPSAGPISGGTVVSVSLTSLSWAATDLAYETDIVPGLSAVYRASHNICSEGALEVGFGTLDDGFMSTSFDRSMYCARILRAPPGKTIRVTITEWHVAGTDTCAGLSRKRFYNCNGSCVPRGSCLMESNGDFLRLYAGNDTNRLIAAFDADDAIEFGTLYSPGNEVLVQFYSDPTAVACEGYSRCSWSLEWSFVHSAQPVPEHYTVPRHTLVSVASADYANLTKAEWLGRQQSVHLRIPTHPHVGTTRLRCWFGNTSVRAYLSAADLQLRCISPSTAFVERVPLVVGYVDLAGNVTMIPWLQSIRTFQFVQVATLEKVQSPSTYHQWINPRSNQLEFGTIGFGPVTGGSRTVVRGQHLVDLPTLSCRWTPFYPDANISVVISLAQHVSDEFIACMSPAVAHQREIMFELDVSLNGQQFTLERLVYLFYPAMAPVGISPARAPAFGGFALMATHPGLSSTKKYVSVYAQASNSLAWRKPLDCPLGSAFVTCGTSICVPRSVCPHNHFISSMENPVRSYAQAQCRWRRSLSSTEVATWLQFVDSASLVTSCDQDGCFDVDVSASGLRTGCYTDFFGDAGSFCEPSVDCCFEELVVPAELSSPAESTDDIVCTAAQMNPGRFLFDVTKNGQDFSGKPLSFGFSHDNVVDVAGMQESSAGQCNFTLYGRGFVNGSSASVYFSHHDVMYNGTLATLPRGTSVVKFHSSRRMSFVDRCADDLAHQLPVTVTTNGQQYQLSTVRIARDNKFLSPSETLHVGPSWSHMASVENDETQVSVVLIQSFVESLVVRAGISWTVDVGVYDSFGGYVAELFNFEASLIAHECSANLTESRGNECRSVFDFAPTSTPGRYRARLAPTASGQYTLMLTRAGEHVGGSPIQMTVLANVASTKHSQVTALVPTLTAGMQVPVVSIKLRDRFLNARTTSGDGRRLCIRVRSVNTSDYYSCSICIAKPMDESNESQHSRCQLGPCGRVCSSDEHGGFEWLYNRSIASRLIVEALLVASDFVSCGSGRCVPVAACSNMGEMLPVYDRCSALNMGHEIGRPSLLTIVPGRTDASKCRTAGTGLVTARTGVVASFRIVAYDLYGNIKTDGSDVFGWSVTHEEEHTCAVSCRSTSRSCDECDGCSTLLPIGTFAACVPDANSSLQGVASEYIAGTGFQVQYVANVPGLYTVRVWLASEQGNASVWGSPWKHVRIVDSEEAPAEDSSSSWDAVSDSSSGSWLSVEQSSTDLNQSDVDGSDNHVSTESVYNVTDASDSDSGSWFGISGQASDFVVNSSLEKDLVDHTCAGATSQKVRFGAAAHLVDSLYFVDILINLSLTPTFANGTDGTDCNYFIASVERSDEEFADSCSSSLGDRFVQCGTDSYCVPRSKCRSRMLTDVNSILGSSNGCTFSPGQLRVSVARGGMLLPGDVILLKSCALEAQGHAGQPLFVMAHVHGPPQNLLPEVLLSAPEELGACNQLVVDGTLSNIAGPQHPLTRWTFQGPDQMQHELIDAVLAHASAEGDLRIAIDFPRLVGVDSGFGLFSFTLTLQNIITGAAGSATITVHRRQNDAPAVRLSQSRKFRPAVSFIIASSLVANSYTPLTICSAGVPAEASVLTFRRREAINLVAIVDRSDCSAPGNLVFEWNATNALQNVFSDTALLHVPPFSMLAGQTADIYVSVSTESTPEKGVAKVSVACIAEPIVTSIRSGDRTVGSVGAFFIDATGSFDPDDPDNEREGFEYSARCKPLVRSDGVKYGNIFTFGCVNNDLIYVDGTTTSTYATRLPASIGAIDHATGEIVLVWPDGDRRHRFTDVTHVYKRGVRCSDLIIASYGYHDDDGYHDVSCDARAGPYMTRDAEPGLFTVNPRFLDAGGTYQFEVTASKDIRADNASVEVLVSQFSTVPSIAIDFPVQTKYSAAHRLALQARQEDGRAFAIDGDAAVALMWTIRGDDGVAIPTHIEAGFLATSPTAPNLVVNPNSLSAGLCYKFRVTATSTMGASAYASVDVCTNSAPHGGDMKVQPNEGAALTTEFVLAASGWWDDDNPLRYRFGFELDGRSALLSAFSSARVVQAVLPPGSYPVTCQVADAYSAVSQAEQSVSVSEYVPTESLSADMSHALAEVQSSGDLSAAAALVDVFAALLQQLKSRRRLQESGARMSDEIETAVLLLLATLRGLLEKLPMVADTVSRLSQTLDVVLTGQLPLTAVGDSVATLERLTKEDGVRDRETSAILVRCASALLVMVASSGNDVSRETTTVLPAAITRLVSELTSGRLAGEYPFVMQTAGLDLTIQTETGSKLDGLDLDFIRLPGGLFPNDTTPIHAQYVNWHTNPRPWAPEHPAETRGNLILGSGAVGFAMHAELDQLTSKDQRRFSLVSLPLLVRFPKAQALTFDSNESHWHCGVWSEKADGWVRGGALLDWHGTNVTCAYDDHRDYTGRLATFVSFWGEIPPPDPRPVNPLAFYVSFSIPVAVVLCGLVMASGHVLLWKDLNVMLFRKKFVVSYLGSTFAAFEYTNVNDMGSTDQAHGCRRMNHNMRARVSLCVVFCGYSRIPQLPKSQRMLVLLSDAAVIISLNSIYLTEIDRYLSVCLVIFAIPAHILVDYMLKWLNAPTVSWLRTEFELQQAFASASFFNRRVGVRSKSSKSFKQGSASSLVSPSVRSPSIRPSASFKSPSILGGASAHLSFTSFTGSTKAGADGSMSHARNRSVIAALGVICSVLFVSALFSRITLWKTLRITNTEFVELMIRCSIACFAKWITIDPVMAITLFPLLAQWDAACLARRAAYLTEDNGEEPEDEEASTKLSPRKQVQIEEKVDPLLETKYERAARDRAARIAGKGTWEWKRDELGLYKVQKKPGTKKSVVKSSDKLVVPHRPAYRVKNKKDEVDKSIGITKAMTKATATRATHEAGNDVVESEADARDRLDGQREGSGAMAAVHIDDSLQPMDPDADGSWMLKRVTKKGGFSWRLLPNQHNSLATLHQGDSEEDAFDDDDQQVLEEEGEEADAEAGSGSSASSAADGAVVAVSAVRARITTLALKAEATGKVTLGPNGIKPRRNTDTERHRQSQRQHQQKQSSLNLTAESILVQGSSETWKLEREGRKVQI